MFGLPQRQPQENAENFKKRFEQENGEIIDVVIVATRLAPEKSSASHTHDASGVLILTDKAVHFMTVQSHHWLMSMFQQSQQNEPRQDLSLRVPLDEIASATPERRAVLDILFGSGTAAFTLFGKDEAQYRFASPLPKEFLKRLNAHLARSAP